MCAMEQPNRDESTPPPLRQLRILRACAGDAKVREALLRVGTAVALLLIVMFAPLPDGLPPAAGAAKAADAQAAPEKPGQ